MVVAGVCIYDDFLDPQDCDEISIYLRSRPFTYGATSTDPGLPIWRGELDCASKLVSRLIDRLNSVWNRNAKPLMAHINAQTVGLDAAWHTDHAPGVTHSLVWFPAVNNWTPDLGGYFLVGEDPTNCSAVLPLANRAVLIPVDAPHCALAPTNRAGTLVRQSIAIKLNMENTDGRV